MHAGIEPTRGATAAPVIPRRLRSVRYSRRAALPDMIWQLIYWPKRASFSSLPQVYPGTPHLARKQKENHLDMI